jgi:hypothetical protein
MSYKEPRSTLSKHDCNCAECNKPIKAGSPCIIDPKGKKVYCTKCGKGKI